MIFGVIRSTALSASSSSTNLRDSGAEKQDGASVCLLDGGTRQRPPDWEVTTWVMVRILMYSER